MELSREIPTLVVPDIHGRYDLVLALLSHELADGRPVIEQISQGRLQLVCVGDYVHAEARAAQRWGAALAEFSGGFKRHRAMDEEMLESLTTVELLLSLKLAYPTGVHLLKGNHENILNEQGRGNLPFGKFAYEGAMVLAWMQRFYPPEILEAFSRVEQGYPLLIRGRGFLISHAEPREYFSAEQVINYRDNHSLILGLTWTDNGAAQDGSVQQMIEGYLGEDDIPVERCWYFGGHRPVPGRFKLRARGSYVQFHNPKAWIIALVPPDGEFDPAKHVIELQRPDGAPGIL